MENASCTLANVGQHKIYLESITIKDC